MPLRQLFARQIRRIRRMFNFRTRQPVDQQQDDKKRTEARQERGGKPTSPAQRNAGVRRQFYRQQVTRITGRQQCGGDVVNIASLE